jgi:hypothetical protein
VVESFWTRPKKRHQKTMNQHESGNPKRKEQKSQKKDVYSRIQTCFVHNKSSLGLVILNLTTMARTQFANVLIQLRHGIHRGIVSVDQDIQWMFGLQKVAR